MINKREGESYIDWCIRVLLDLVGDLEGDKRSAVDYAIGYMIGIREVLHEKDN